MLLRDDCFVLLRWPPVVWLDRRTMIGMLLATLPLYAKGPLDAGNVGLGVAVAPRPRLAAPVEVA